MFCACSGKFKAYLAIHSIRHSTMTRNTITKILHITPKSKGKILQIFFYKIWIIKWRRNHWTLILKALLKPLAKKPPKGAIIEAKSPSHNACHCTGKTSISFQGNCGREKRYVKFYLNIIITISRKKT